MRNRDEKLKGLVSGWKSQNINEPKLHGVVHKEWKLFHQFILKPTEF